VWPLLDPCAPGGEHVAQMATLWSSYAPQKGFVDELVTPAGRPRPPARAICRWLSKMGMPALRGRQEAVGLEIANMGITFTVYGKGSSIDRAWPLDVIPRVIGKTEWDRVAEGLKQRQRALNLFIGDLYAEQEVVKAGVFPKEVLATSPKFLEICRGQKPAYGVWAHICGSDLVRDGKGNLLVLEDNLRVPSGVSYMLENRVVMMRRFPELFQAAKVLPIDDYPQRLFETLSSLSPRKAKQPRVAVLTPGVFNSAYFEHAFLAQQMGAELVEGRDLFVDADDCVYMKTIAGPERVDVIYRRIDDEFIDPEAFRPDSMLGIRGLFRAWAAGNVALANAPGCGVADDKVVYTFVPDIIRFYLGEEPIIGNVESYRCMDKDARAYVLEHIGELVVKPANESGGYGLLVGPKATRRELEKYKRLIRKDPRNYIAQPLLQLSTTPTIVDSGVEPRHIDLRPFGLQGKKLFVTNGGLTRVALPRGSYVVNSSQGGGSKDTWIVRDTVKPTSRSRREKESKA